VKTYAHNTPAARNASVEFDLETLSPTYRLSIGLPGTSRAFAIAERLGLGPTLVEDARSRLSRAQQEFEETLASIKASQQVADEALDRAQEAEARARERQREAEQERTRARIERDAAIAAAHEEAERALTAVREEIDAVRGALDRETITAGRLDTLAARLEERLAAVPRVDATVAEAVAPAARWEVGMVARSTRGGWEGPIDSIDEGQGRATIAAGALRVAVDLADLVAPTVRVEAPRTAGAAAAAISRRPGGAASSGRAASARRRYRASDAERARGGERTRRDSSRAASTCVARASRRRWSCSSVTSIWRRAHARRGSP
jgi:DNA mismatch repair protein MutS2